MEGTEYWTGITKLRKQLVKQAHGRVLESCAGTGRNLSFYNFDAGGNEGEGEGEGEGREVENLVCVDRSAAMVAIARGKWQKTHPLPAADADANAQQHGKDPTAPPSTDPTAGKVSFVTQPAHQPLPDPSHRFDTVVQTMGLCSLPSPALHLLHLASLTKPASEASPGGGGSPGVEASPGGKLLLLEHGRSPYTFVNWVMDRSARPHAEKHGCWYNRDIGAILRECEGAGILVVEDVRRPWWQVGTVWVVRCRVGPSLGGRGLGKGEEGVDY